jgi:hypothetical protein
MSEQQDTESQNGNQTDGVDAAALEQEEKRVLRDRLRMMGKNPSNNASVETLRKALEDAMNGTPEQPQAPAQPMPGAQQYMQAPPGDIAPKEKTLAQHLRDENLRLVRLRITNLDPKKKDLPGEILTVGNNYLGVVKKYVPYGEATDDGYHVPWILYKLMRDRKFVDIRVKKDPRTGQEVVHRRMVKEFGLEILPPLTKAQLQTLATAQLSASSVD